MDDGQSDEGKRGDVDRGGTTLIAITSLRIGTFSPGASGAFARRVAMVFRLTNLVICLVAATNREDFFAGPRPSAVVPSLTFGGSMRKPTI